MNARLDEFKDDIDWGVYKSQNQPKDKTPQPSSEISDQSKYEDVRIGVPPKRPEQGQMSNGILGSLNSFLPKIPPGLNVATGMMSLAFPGEKGEIVKNLPQALTGNQPGFSEKTEQFIGEMLPGLEGGPQAVKTGYKGIKKGIDYIDHKKISQELMGKLGEGNVPENIENLSKRLKFGKESAKEEALAPKTEFMSGNKEKILNSKKYLSDEDVTKYYPKKGDLYNAHEEFLNKPSIENADRLMSKLKDEIRELSKKDKKHGLGDVQEARLQNYKSNLDNLKKDFSDIVEKLPQNQKGKYQEFLKKYATNVAPYEESAFTIRKLASGETKGVSQESIEKVFSNPNPSQEILKIINDIGPSGWNNIVYNMLMKYKPGDVKGMANAILEGARKGSPIITEEMVKAANVALKKGKISSLVKASAGAAAGGLLGGPIGAGIGAVSPYLLANKDVISKLVGKIKR